MNTDPKTRLSLIAKLANTKDEKAWAEFVSIYEPVIQRFLAKYGLQYADAAEVTQEVLGGVLQSIESWDHLGESSTFRGWLYRLTRNKAVDLIRRRTKEAQFKLISDSRLGQIAQSNFADADSEFLGEFERQLFHWAVEKIRPTIKLINWQAFWRSTVEGQPIERVSKDLQIDSSAIYVARCRIMKRLIQLVQTRLDESTS